MTTNMPSSSPSTTRNLSPQLGAALAAAERGWPVFPIHQNGKYPAVKDWENRATTDPAQLEQWWEKVPYNIGIACGPAGLVVIDLDSARGQSPPPQWAEHGVTHGSQVLAFLAQRAGEPDPIDTYTVISPNDGEHRYYLTPPDLALRNTIGELGNGLGWRIDTRAHGGNIIAAGSVRRIGTRLRCYQAHPQRPADPAPLPQWLATRLSPPPPPQRTPIRLRPGAHRLDAYLQAALLGEAKNVTLAISGTRAGTLFTSAAALGELVGAGLLHEQLALDTLLDAARGHSGVDGWNEREALHHITNGIARGRRNPRDVAERTV